jgi:copper chaperone CopZ
MTSIARFKSFGMHCPSCSMLVKMNLSDIAGVCSVESDHSSGVTTIEYDPAVVNVDHLRHSINDSGYDTEIL